MNILSGGQGLVNTTSARVIKDLPVVVSKQLEKAAVIKHNYKREEFLESLVSVKVRLNPVDVATVDFLCPTAVAVGLKEDGVRTMAFTLQDNQFIEVAWGEHMYGVINR